MIGKLRISVADDEPDMCEYMQRILPRLGHEVISVARNGNELIDHFRSLQPDLVITDIRMPELDGIEAATKIFAERPIPVILISGYYDPGLIERAEADHIMAYLVKPIKQADLLPAIAIATRRFQQFEELRKESDSLRKALEDRKVIERAKGLIMKNTGFDEHQAFQRLQRIASERNLKLADVAKSILVADDAYRPGEKK